MPALHWAITRSGTEMMNSGAPITGSDRRPLNRAGMDIGGDFLVVSERLADTSKGITLHCKDASIHKDGMHHTKTAWRQLRLGAAIPRPDPD